MRVGTASGLQVAFFIYTTWLLVVPLGKGISKALELDPGAQALLDRYIAIVVAGLGLALIRPLRRLSLAILKHPIAPEHRSEVAIASVLAPLHAFGAAGAFVLWWHFTEGPAGVAGHVAALGSHAEAIARAFSPAPLAAHLLLAVIAGPVIEELVFRRLLYSAWAAQYGWFNAMLLSAVVFASLHDAFLPSFLGAILFTCVYRRTGIRGAILVHASWNLMATYPLLGRWIFPRDLEAPGDLASWIPQVTALAAVMVIWPTYAWMCREPKDAPIVLDAGHAALPR